MMPDIPTLAHSDTRWLGTNREDSRRTGGVVYTEVRPSIGAHGGAVGCGSVANDSEESELIDQR